jgi:predicted adenylyl cyclase CyaB
VDEALASAVTFDSSNHQVRKPSKAGRRAGQAICQQSCTRDRKCGLTNLCVHKPPLVSYSLLMPRNVEIKAHIESVEALLPRAQAIADSGPAEILQDDTFFHCPNGRLKLRAFSEASGELIFYQRPDSTGPKECFYVLSPTASPNTLREALSLAYGQSGRVRKHRTLLLVGRTRIHLDRVEGLGDFLELEVVLSDDESTEAGVKTAHELLAKLGISPQQLIEGAYIDLLQQKV